MKIVLFAFFLQCIIIILQMSHIHMDTKYRNIVHNIMLIKDIFVWYVLIKLYLKSNKNILLLPFVFAAINFIYFGHNTGENNDGDGYPWGIMNGLNLGLLGMFIRK
jgi:hypothetical protein